MSDEQGGTPLHLDEQNPWPGLAAYDEASKRFFHGRDADIAEMQRLIKLSPFVALFGKSGLGKSSLLQAGLFPRLRDDRFLPVYLRLDYTESASKGVLQQVAERLTQEVSNERVDAAPFAPGEGVWAYLQRREWPIWTADNYRLTPVLVFDQFEEVFSRGASEAHMKKVLDELADVVGDRLPAELAENREAARDLNLQSQQYRVVLSFRSDFLAEFEAWEKQANFPRRESFHLTALSRERAVKAIEIAGAAVVEPGVAEQIVDFLLNREGRGTTGRASDVEPVLLSLCCFQLNNRRKRPAKIDADLVKSVGEGIIKGFYDEALAGMPARVSVFIEDNLIQGERFRNSYALDAAMASGELTSAELDALTRRRLLRVDPQGEVPRIELIHDRLVRVVREARDARYALEAQQEAREEAARHAKLESERAEREAKAKYDQQRLDDAELEKSQLRNWRMGLAAAAVLLLAASVFLWFQFQRSESFRKQANFLADRNAYLLDKTTAELAKVKAAAIQDDSVHESGGVRGDSSIHDVLSAVQSAESTLKVASTMPAGGAASPPKTSATDPSPSPSTVNTPPGARTLSVNNWRLSSGGCLKGNVSVSGPAVFWVDSTAEGIVVGERFDGKGDGFTVKVRASQAAPLPRKSTYTIETLATWSGPNGRSFTSAGTDLVTVDSNGKPLKAVLRTFRTICP